MKPGDHPEFFRWPAPEGRSRESTIRLDARGRFWHDGAPVEHPGMARAFASWLARHPDDGRYILTNGYDWTYLNVERTPYFVVGVRADPAGPQVMLFDGTEEPLAVSTLRVDEEGALEVTVKDGAFVARFTPDAQRALLPFLEEGDGGALLVRQGGERVPVPEAALRGV